MALNVNQVTVLGTVMDGIQDLLVENGISPADDQFLLLDVSGGDGTVDPVTLKFVVTNRTEWDWHVEAEMVTP